MATFNEVFGGSNIYPSNATYLALSPLTANVQLEWPIEQAISGALVVADIMDLNPTAPGLSVAMPDARQASEGFTALFNNIGGQTVQVNDNLGNTIVSLVSGTVWQVYLVDNTTQGGTWRIFQFGASVSVAVAAALAGSGLKAIGSTLNEKMLISARNANYNIVSADRGNVQQWTAGVGTFTLPDPATIGADWFTVIKNSGSGNLTVNTIAGNIDGNASATLAPGQSFWIITDGGNYYSLAGSSASSGSGFNLVTIDVSGTGNFVLAGAQLNQIGYKFTGVLTGNRAIIVPNTIQEYWVDNETTGAFNLTVGTLGQVGPPVIPQGNRNILYCDGTNVVSATSAAIVFPISIGQGGTGATTAANARTNLGATAVGNSVFTAVSVAAAQSALSVPPTSRLINTSGMLTGGGDLSADRTLTYNFQGCTCTNAAAITPLSTVVAGSRLTWDTENLDIGAWHSLVTNPSRMTVPAGVAYVEVNATLNFDVNNVNNNSWKLSVQLTKNGVTVEQIANFHGIQASAGSQLIMSVALSSGPIAVAPGDYFELFAGGTGIAGTETWQLEGAFQCIYSIKAIG